jgi:hypothetical protein
MLPKRLRVILVIGLLGIMAVFQITSIRGEVQTIDEGAHLTAGVSYILKGDFRLNEEHPPLFKLLAGIAVLTTRPHINFDDPAWQQGNQWGFAQNFLYHSGNNADKILFAARLPMILLGLALGFVLYLWGRRLGGDLAGLFTLGWYVFDPNFLAHSRYVTNDVPVTLGYALTLYLLVRWLDTPNWKRGAWFGVIFGLTQVTKFSALFLWPLIILLVLIYVFSKHTPWLRRTLQTLGWAIAGSIVVIFLAYFGQFKSAQSDPWVQASLAERSKVVTTNSIGQQPVAVQRLIKLSEPNTVSGKIINKLLNIPIPAWSYGKGVALLLNHDYWGHKSYLMNHYSNFGWWWYFPLAFAVKTPFATLILLLAAILGALQAWTTASYRNRNPGLWILGISAFLYMLWSLTSHINLGLRHIFPVYPAVFVTIGCFIAAIFTQQKKLLKLIALCLVVLYTMTSVLAYPFYTSYFSEIVGGTVNGPRYLVDSNIDWGQDVKTLKTFMQKHDIPYVCLSYFGQANLEYYGIDFRYLPTKDDPHEPTQVNCVVAISVTSLLSEDGIYWWLRKYQPDTELGGTIYVYDFRDGRSPQLAKNPI